MTIAVDFDGVIHSYDRGWADGLIYGELLPGAREGLAALMTETAVVVHTTRDAEPVVEWLTARGIPAVTEQVASETGWVGVFWNDQTTLLVTSRKLPAVAYLDDRAVRFWNWSRALRDLRDVGAIR